MADKERVRRKINAGANSAGTVNRGAPMNRNAYVNRAYVNRGGAVAASGAERYRDRIRDGGITPRRKFPNERRRIVTGKDLTTPLRRARVRSTEHKRIKVSAKTIEIKKKKLLWLPMLKVIAVGICVCAFICSRILLFEADQKINRTTTAIKSELNQVHSLERQFSLENDPADILRIAREELGMIEEKDILKFHIRSHRENKAVIVDRENRLARIFAAIVNAGK